MRGKRLLFASPLIAALAFGTIDIASASAAPTSASTGENHFTKTSKRVPPTCKKNFKGKNKKTCASGFNEGYAAGKASCKPGVSMMAPTIEDAAYVHGYDAGYEAGKAKC
ncbi:hypothetical protein Aph01nite_37160 [Acrocarpospora phusangensis]|uniref:Uncharacterized protein n=1 Tax=Acrocarpospora phusangensis TaxID=1070424 RepID=A0A919QAT5_9ACTN|nr:hypothetical protein [Acrocarpospora phusangensis]GIH25406.1 hypothetical protein Aph01nite_37160 [Acrocarpospora phusangensis]